ncbi:MAG TPA: hypothetical protein VLA00_08535 [Xanthobacteraceae bacterium]|nr:hypothetical protein [Xanthobacteraceae bacterium]
MSNPVKRGESVPPPLPERPATTAERRSRPAQTFPVGSIAAIELQLGF